MLELWVLIFTAILVAKAIGTFVSLWVTNTKWYIRYAQKVGRRYLEQGMSDDNKEDKAEKVDAAFYE